MKPPRPRQPAYLSCEGKEPFSTPQVAIKVLKRWTAAKRRQGKKMIKPVASYRCGHFGFFHIGGMATR